MSACCPRWRSRSSCRTRIADEAIKAIMEAARTGEIGDGRVFVLPMLESYRIRTGEQES